MKVLVATNHLEITGGSETFTYALVTGLMRRGYMVEYYCDETLRGEFSQRMERNLGVEFMSHSRYDLILANHTTMVEKLHKMGYLIQTCHGVFPPLEQPSPYADAHVAVSEEVRLHVVSKGFACDVILNGIDCERFSPQSAIATTPQSVLSLCQGDEANEVVRSGCEALGLEFVRASKLDDNIFEIERWINRADLVVGIGRSLYDAMACGRAVISLDSRSYSTTFDGHSCGGDGYLTAESVAESVLYNCTGRGNGGRYIDRDRFAAEVERYRAEDGEALRSYALESLNIDRSVDKYLDVYDSRPSGIGAIVAAIVKMRRCYKYRQALKLLERG